MSLATPAVIASERQLKRNMRLYVITRIFQKRVFLPLAAIYFTSQAGITLKGVGLLGGAFSLTQIIAELPTGIFADHFGKVISLRLGAALNVLACSLYVVVPFPFGIAVGYCAEALGYSFFGGASEAILHDTLEAQGRGDDYTKIHSRIQAVALLINAGLVAAVSLTYKIDPRLPFAIGAMVYTALFVVNCLIHEVFSPSRATEQRHIRQHVQGLKLFRNLALFFLTLGFISAVYTAPSDFFNLQVKNLGMAPYTIGYIYAGASVVGFLMGFVVHRLKKLSLLRYILVDVLVLTVSLLSLTTTNLGLVIGVFLINMSFWRYRRIIYQATMLEYIPTRDKATLFSAINVGTESFELLLPILFGLSVAHSGIPHSYGLLLGATVAMAVLLYAMVLRLNKNRMAVISEHQ